jgi:hypothetical protein
MLQGESNTKDSSEANKSLTKEKKDKRKQKKKLRKRPNLDFLLNSDPFNPNPPNPNPLNPNPFNPISFNPYLLNPNPFNSNPGFENRNYLQNGNRKPVNKSGRKLIEDEPQPKVEYRAGQFDEFLNQGSSQQVIFLIFLRLKYF